MIVENQKNLKVHYAGTESLHMFYACQYMDIKYSLYTVFPFLERTVLKTKKSPLIPAHLKGSEYEIPKYIASKSKHVIQDSGLFTLMFGSHKGNHSEQMLKSWYDGLIDFTKQNNNGASIVEIDCQKIFGVDLAWKFRERMKNDLPENRVINVFHKEDGQKGLDRLIEFSDYLAISVPELRFLGQKKSVINIANYIKNKKPNIDIHLLGCTENKLLKELNFCSSADSTSWKSGQRFGFVDNKHIDLIKNEKCRELINEKDYEFMLKYSSAKNIDALLIKILECKINYEKNAGDQN